MCALFYKYRDINSGIVNKYASCKLHIPYVDNYFELNKFITNLLQTVGDLKLSEVEYTIDFVCSGPVETRNMFYLIGHYLYVPHIRNTTFKKTTEHKNMTFYFFTNADTKKMNVKLRCYERAGNRKKSDKGFKFINLDRVRIEFPVKRTKLKKYGISTLRDLNDGTKFSDIIFNGIFVNLQFRKPKNFVNDPLAEIKTFLSKNNKLKLYFLQQKHITSTGTSKSRDLINNDRFSDLISRIKMAVDEYEFDCLKISRIRMHNTSLLSLNKL